jgi:hypothetical protein
MSRKVPIIAIRQRQAPAARDVVEGGLYFVGDTDDDDPLELFLGAAPYRLKPVGSPAAVGGFTFTQASPALIWTINHNLGYNPLITVLRDGVTPVEALVSHISTNQTRINFLTPTRGTARLV